MEGQNEDRSTFSVGAEQILQGTEVESFIRYKSESFIQSTPILAEDVVARPYLNDVAMSFHQAGFDLEVVLPWLAALPDEVLLETSNEHLMWKWVEWKSHTTDMSTVSEGTDVIQLQKLGLVLEAAKYLQQQFSFEPWRGRNLHAQMTWWIEEARYTATMVDSIPYPKDDPPPLNQWIISKYFGVPTYYVSQDRQNTFHLHGAAIIDNLLENFIFKRDDNLVLFHATSLRHVSSVLRKIRVDYRLRTTDFSVDRAFYTTTEFNTAFCHAHWRWRGCKAIIVFVLPTNEVKSPEHYLELLDERVWKKVVASCSNGQYSEELKGKSFVQGWLLSNPDDVIKTGMEFGVSRAADVARVNEPPNYQLAVIDDSGAKILDSAAKCVIVLP
ncbi:hypothetical protein BC936DRAFT_148960 [Jimgerdemannia flammicorona]|uniref:Uncharacterized protein n=1 Tax=Jimgerdemannia flammicorona TaxID=994334 RepID=A0A433D1W1_9FUNG|nr:hypothetical protein BC936DRAFT_148960 [Jimgerdemannia flammicorona]